MSFEKKLSTKIFPPANGVHLQGLPGYFPGTPARDLCPGMVTIWNYGYKERILSVTPSKTGKTVAVEMESIGSGYRGTRKLASGRLVVVV